MEINERKERKKERGYKIQDKRKISKRTKKGVVIMLI
jgi:hypothetical protein